MTQTKIKGEEKLLKLTMDEADIYRAAVNLWGQRAQLDMVIEECSELIKAICKYRRYIRDPSWKDIILEAIDVEIMVQQIKHVFHVDKEMWEHLKDVKLAGLQEHIESSKSPQCVNYWQDCGHRICHGMKCKGFIEKESEK